ncbi:ABC transporter transmembrane domain-containing protein [Chromobacterium violaceum]|uniref:Multidrug resistance-like ATP-binding protein MdlA n=1 Tax=Chromobacterium violaceum (strain ATCC 12472 / DSM 30191 / JCM 1249 / CCUG 213 / NBRC 12614 / NCIMB 9131 / NCTC 9757 / MK) TaxID=243365 RepID=Q7P0D6_CHRVO|nr:ABC transporter transmembrane domain-containing protein [Chromobacterium violaceum]AAQ58307.1 ABC transporter ATP-binding membrane protein [Chromobacterium violaceum ATCC 12472]MBP4050349.1 ATP-binding cassette domain-containing protein [Chromobacterium violaceum]MBX9267486.1 ATP-binding cassette domain-containing protein [Chromobacterium violaceum]OQS24909.1 ABC transporter ATP-binding protein [Chromobacterium violaceum]OQS46284.1 ABC transporter ATP-binding protein [Chromobacterium violac
MSLTRLLFSFVSRHWRSYILAALMLAAVAVLTVMIPRQVGHIVDALAARRLTGDALLLELAQLLAMGVAIYGLRVGWRLQLFTASYTLGVELRGQLYQRLATQGPAFFQRQRTGDLMARATNDIDSVEMAAGEAVLAGFDGLLTLVLVLAMMTLGVDWRLALAALLPFPFMAWAFSRISNHIHREWGEALSRFGKLNDHVQETLSGVRTLRALGLEARNDAELSRLAAAASDSSFEAQRWEAAFEPTVGVALVTSTAIALALGGYLVWHGQLTIGALTSFSMYLVQLIWPMFAAGWVLSLLQRGAAAWRRLQPVLDAEPDVADDGRSTELAPGALVFDNLTFHYSDDAAAALRQVSAQLPPGQTLGVVGPTGSGKSTLLKLLMRQYPLQQGAIRWSGADVADYRLQTLRGAISWVPQEAFLFSASVAENIALARPDASQQDIERVARLAAVHDDILRLPQGYATPVGEKGVALSGGQRQRLAIARALLADAPLLLLDDALSAVDTDTESRILGHLREARRGRSVIIVSHRLSAVADADHIVVLNHGRIAEQGSHDELLRLDGWYAGQWRYQQLEASLDEI